MDELYRSLNPIQKKEFQQQRFHDLIQRSWPGLISYALVWWAIALPRLWYEPTSENLSWLSGFGFLILLCCGLRIRLLRRFRQRLADERAKVPWEIFVGTALNASAWGVIAAVSLLPDTPLSPLVMVMILTTSGICAGGVCSLAISRYLVCMFLGCMLTPSIIVLALGYSEHPVEMAIAGIIFWISMYLISGLPRREYYTASCSNIKLSHQAAYLQELSRVDSLTGLNNRRQFEHLFETELKRASRGRYPISLLLIDLDHFKHINDQHGHLIGDECLKRVATTLSAQLKRATDAVARFGGEEFAVILPGTSEADARQVAESIRQALETLKIPTATENISLTASLGGVSLIPSQEGSARDIIKLADDALYRAKHEGRNRCCFAPGDEPGVVHEAPAADAPPMAMRYRPSHPTPKTRTDAGLSQSGSSSD